MRILINLMRMLISLRMMRMRRITMRMMMRKITMRMMRMRKINMRSTAASASITRPVEPPAQAAHVPIQIHHHPPPAHHHDDTDHDDAGRLSQGQV